MPSNRHITACVSRLHHSLRITQCVSAVNGQLSGSDVCVCLRLIKESAFPDPSFLRIVSSKTELRRSSLRSSNPVFIWSMMRFFYDKNERKAKKILPNQIHIHIYVCILKYIFLYIQFNSRIILYFQKLFMRLKNILFYIYY